MLFRLKYNNYCDFFFGYISNQNSWYKCRKQLLFLVFFHLYKPHTTHFWLNSNRYLWQSVLVNLYKNGTTAFKLLRYFSRKVSVKPTNGSYGIIILPSAYTIWSFKNDQLRFFQKLSSKTYCKHITIRYIVYLYYWTTHLYWYISLVVSDDHEDVLDVFLGSCTEIKILKKRREFTSNSLTIYFFDYCY